MSGVYVYNISIRIYRKINICTLLSNNNNCFFFLSPVLGHTHARTLSRGNNNFSTNAHVLCCRRGFVFFDDHVVSRRSTRIHCDAAAAAAVEFFTKNTLYACCNVHHCRVSRRRCSLLQPLCIGATSCTSERTGNSAGNTKKKKKLFRNEAIYKYQ